MISNVLNGMDTHTYAHTHPHTLAPWGEGAAYDYAEVDAAVSLGVRVLDRPSLPPGIEGALDLHMNNRLLSHLEVFFITQNKGQNLRKGDWVTSQSRDINSHLHWLFPSLQ